MILFFISVVLLAVASMLSIRYLRELYRWNDGISRETGRPWKYLRYDSNGRYVYRSGNSCYCRISFRSIIRNSNGDLDG